MTKMNADRLHFYAVEISLLQEVSPLEHHILPGIDLKYVEFLNSVIHCSYENSLLSSICSAVLKPSEPVSNICSAESLDTFLIDRIQSYLIVEPEDESILRQLVVMFIGISCLQLFVQNNFVGPPTSLDPLMLLPACFHDDAQGIMDYVHRKLIVDDETVYQFSSCALYLFIAKILLVTCKDLLKDCETAGLWQLRTLKIHQALLQERSDVLKTAVLTIITTLSEKEIFSGFALHNRDIQIQFYVEAGHICYFYYESGMAKKHFEEAQKRSGLTLQLTGILGKRTRFQANDIAQLVLCVEKSPDEQIICETSEYEVPTKINNFLLPKNIRLDDEAVLEKMNPKDTNELPVTVMTATQQALILGLCYNYRRTHETEGQGGIVQEEMMSFINCVLSQPRNWSVQTSALLLRSQWEKGNTRRLQRSLAQLEELVNQFRRSDTPASLRLPLVYSVSLPPQWIVERELGKLLDEIGAVSSALDVYLRLKSWDDVIVCYAKLGHCEKAEKLIRDQLVKHETANLWCYLGDVTHNPEHYHRAWDVSHGRSSRAQRALAYYHFGKREVKKSLQHFEKSLQISPLQVTVWFTYGCAALECEEFSLAATAFRRCVNLDNDNFAAWSNLATAYIKANNKPRAFVTYQEALKCDYENWRIWENFLAVAVDVGEFDEAIRAYHRLLELRDKHTDVPVLTILVRVIKENIRDTSGEPASRLKPKLLQLFGHVTAKVTSCADIWRLYSELLTTDATDVDLTTHERAVQYLRTAHSCAMMAANWEKDAAKCIEIAKLSHQLAEAYQSCMLCTADIEHLSRLKSSGRLALKGVIAKIRRQHTDVLTGVLNPDFVDSVQELENDLLRLSDAVNG